MYRRLPRASTADPSRPSTPIPVAPPIATPTPAQQVRCAIAWASTRDATLVWLASHVALAAFTYVTLTLAAGGAGVAPGAPLDGANALDRWDSWDGANFYDKIAVHGYPSSDEGMATFFPLYPLLLRGVLFLTGTGPGRTALAGLIVSNAALLVALIGVAQLVCYELGTSRIARVTALHFLLAYPLAFFLTAGGSDGVFLACAVWALYVARRGWWRWAALAALLAGLDRLTALVLVPALAWEYGRVHRWGLWARRGACALRETWRERRGASWRPHVAALAWPRARTRALARRAGGVAELLAVLLAAPAGVGAFFALLAHVYGTPGVYFRIETGYFNHHLSWPWQVAAAVWRDWHAVPLFSYGTGRGLVDSAPLLAAVALTIASVCGWGAPRLPAMYALYLAGVVWLSSAAPIYCAGGCFPSDSLVSVGRYLTAAFPLVLPLLYWCRRWPWLAPALMCAGVLLQGAILTWYLLRVWIV